LFVHRSYKSPNSKKEVGDRRWCKGGQHLHSGSDEKKRKDGGQTEREKGRRLIGNRWLRKGKGALAGQKEKVKSTKQKWVGGGLREGLIGAHK